MRGEVLSVCIAVVLFLIIVAGLVVPGQDSGNVVVVQKVTADCPAAHVVRFGDGHDGCVVETAE